MDDTGSSQQLSVEMTPTEVTLVMPNFFGLAVNVAMDQATAAGLIVARIIDSYGTDIPPGGIPDPAQASPVLNQVRRPARSSPRILRCNSTSRRRSRSR